MLTTLESEGHWGKADEVYPPVLGYSLPNLAHQETFLAVRGLIYPTGCYKKGVRNMTSGICYSSHILSTRKDGFFHYVKSKSPVADKPM